MRDFFAWEVMPFLRVLFLRGYAFIKPKLTNDWGCPYARIQFRENGRSIPGIFINEGGRHATFGLMWRPFFVTFAIYYRHQWHRWTKQVAAP